MTNFNELQQVWDAQHNEPLYALNAEALHNLIRVKKRKAFHITRASELLLLAVNLGNGIFIASTAFFHQHHQAVLYAMAGWMFVTALYVLISLFRRIKSANSYDRSMHSDLNQALEVAAYQVRLSGTMRWNILPLAALTLAGTWNATSFPWPTAAILIFFALALWASAREHAFYKSRKRELEVLKNKLESWV